MGVISDLKAIKLVQRIKKGKKEKLSISQVTGLITNMLDAKRNLNSEDFQQIYNLFTDLRKCNTKIEMDYEGYCKTAVDIIKRFDKIAPYEKYSGGNELEFSFLMNDLRSIDKNYPTENSVKTVNEYANLIATNSNGVINQNEAENFAELITSYSCIGKENTLLKFDRLINKMIEKEGISVLMYKVHYLLGVLQSNNIINEDELKSLGDNYQNQLISFLTKEKDNPNK